MNRPAQAATIAVGIRSYRLVATPRLVTAESALLSPIAGEGWLAVGDAAASFDPLSSHGIGAALWSGELAAVVLRRFLNGDAAALTVLAPILRAKSQRAIGVMRATTGTRYDFFMETAE